MAVVLTIVDSVSTCRTLKCTFDAASISNVVVVAAVVELVEFETLTLSL